MIVVTPETYTKVDFDAEVIAAAAQRALERVAPLPDDLDVTVNIVEDNATNRVKITSVEPVVFNVDGLSLIHI